MKAGGVARHPPVRGIALTRLLVLEEEQPKGVVVNRRATEWGNEKCQAGNG